MSLCRPFCNCPLRVGLAGLLEQLVIPAPSFQTDLRRCVRSDSGKAPPSQEVGLKVGLRAFAARQRVRLVGTRPAWAPCLSSCSPFPIR